MVEGAEGADEHDAEGPLGVVEGEALGAAAAAGVPDDHRRVEPDGVHKGRDVRHVVVEAVAALRRSASPCPRWSSAKAWIVCGGSGSSSQERHESP